MNKAVSSSGGDWRLNLMPHFLDQTRSRLAQIEAHRQAVQDGSDPVAAMKAICDVVHKISGTADTFGFSDLGALAQNVEKVSLTLSPVIDDSMITWSRLDRALIPLLQEIGNVLEPI